MSLIDKMLLIACVGCGHAPTMQSTSDDTPPPDQQPDATESDAAVGPDLDADGVIRIYPATTTPPIKLEYGARHENGDRYNANHTFINDEVTGYFLTANTEKIEMKTDGPNHSGCDTLPRCQWAEPRIDIASVRASISSEYPHPTNHPDAACPSCQDLTGSLANQWIGYKVIAYRDAAGYRVYEQWLDRDGLDADNKPANHWVRMMIETNTGQVMPNPLRALPTGGAGLEAEIRCHNGHETQMKLGKIQEIVAP